jgi:RHS repeat-associated protein
MEEPAGGTAGSKATASVTINGTLQSKLVGGQAARAASATILISGEPANCDFGYVYLTVGSYSEPGISYLCGSTAQQMAQALVTYFGSTQVTATTQAGSDPDHWYLILTANAAGTSGNSIAYSLTYSTFYPGQYPPPYGFSPASGSLSGGLDAVAGTTVYDAGTITLGLNGYSATASYGNGTGLDGTAAAVASDLVSRINAQPGLDYFGARYYSSVIGRWMTPDWSDEPSPIPYAKLTNPQSLNLYSYVTDDPLSHTDLDGHFQLHSGTTSACPQAPNGGNGDACTTTTSTSVVVGGTLFGGGSVVSFTQTTTTTYTDQNGDKIETSTTRHIQATYDENQNVTHVSERTATNSYTNGKFTGCSGGCTGDYREWKDVKMSTSDVQKAMGGQAPKVMSQLIANATPQVWTGAFKAAAQHPEEIAMRMIDIEAVLEGGPIGALAAIAHAVDDITDALKNGPKP